MDLHREKSFPYYLLYSVETWTERNIEVLERLKKDIEIIYTIKKKKLQKPGGHEEAIPYHKLYFVVVELKNVENYFELLQIKLSLCQYPKRITNLKKKKVQ